MLPRRVIVEFGVNEIIHSEFDVLGMAEEQLQVIAAKIDSATSVVSAHPHRL
jgi:hypothetical protein